MAAEFLPGAIEEMLAVGSGTRSTKPLYHAQIETAAGKDLTRDQQAYAIAALERRLGLIDHARAVIECHTGGQNHLHVLWCRVDIEMMTVVPDSGNYRAHEEVARQLERDFGHAWPPASARRW